MKVNCVGRGSITFVGRGSITPEKTASNTDHTKSLGLPYVDLARVHPLPLALVGGGPSINDRIEEIRNWPGDVWAVNGARAWCESHGIDATLVSVDPNPILADLVRGSPRSILSSQCDPSVFEALRGSQVEYFDIGPKDIFSGPTSASTVPALSLKMGYPGVTFFGCEGSWDYLTHAYEQDEEDQCLINWRVLVECGGRKFLTCAEYLMQTECLSTLIRLAPDVFRERSGGLLSQMIETPEIRLEAITKKLAHDLGYDENLRKIA